MITDFVFRERDELQNSLKALEQNYEKLKKENKQNCKNYEVLSDKHQRAIEELQNVQQELEKERVMNWRVTNLRIPPNTN